jgi:hypothetical protein
VLSVKRLERRQIRKWVGTIRCLSGHNMNEAHSIPKLEISVTKSRRLMLSKLFEDFADICFIFGVRAAVTLYCTSKALTHPFRVA